jgi:rhamnosyltransferase
VNQQTNGRVVAVISAFHPPLELPGRVSKLMHQVSGVVIVDDGSDPSHTNPIFAELEALGAVLVRLDRN